MSPFLNCNLSYFSFFIKICFNVIFVITFSAYLLDSVRCEETQSNIIEYLSVKSSINSNDKNISNFLLRKQEKEKLNPNFKPKGINFEESIHVKFFKFLKKLSLTKRKIIKREPTSFFYKKNYNKEENLITSLGHHSDSFLENQNNRNFLKELPVIIGDSAFLYFPSLNTSLLSLLPSEMKLIQADFLEKRRWNLTFNNGLRINLPEQEINEAIFFLKGFLSRHINDIESIEIDLCCKNRFYLRSYSQRIPSLI